MTRIIGELGGKEAGPLLILVGGLHGNEHRGIEALVNVISAFEDKQIRGKVLALRGNLKALKESKRFLSRDLNLSWSTHLKDAELGEELSEREELKSIIDRKLSGWDGDIYLIDLHTTSAPTVPFAVIGKDAATMNFVRNMNIPFVTGLTGILDGTLLNWMSKKGHVGLAFEAGSHHSKTSLIKHEAFVKLCLHAVGCYLDYTESELLELKELLSDELSPRHQHFRLLERYQIDEDEEFVMEEGFTNFQKIYKGEVLAQNQFGDIMSAINGNIFMPLYQEEGKDGFFIIKPAEDK